MSDKKIDEDWKKQAQIEKAVDAAKGAAPEPAAPGIPEPPSREMLGPPDFLQFVSGLAAQALVHLGAIPNPMTGRTEADPEHARTTIDLLELLKEKTRGNLTPEETAHFERILMELRLAFVDATK